MRLEDLLTLAGQDRLYPGVILHGGGAEARRRAATALARTLLCEAAPEDRPCGHCRHCSRVAWPDAEGGFHPDLHVLARDLRTVTSAEATKAFLKQAYSAPYEARGQVFVVAEADTLSGEAADALLKILEEPPTRSARHFLLLAASRLDLLPTLRSRSLSLYLGASTALDEAELAPVAEAFGQAFEGWLESRGSVYLLSAAEALAAAPGWEDPRARRPWALAAAALLRNLPRCRDRGERRRLLAAAEALLDGPRLRLRGIPQGRILEGLLARHLGA